MKSAIGVGLVGYAFMGRAHSQAWRSVGAFFDLPILPRLAALAGRSADATEAAARTLGWAATETDWQRLVKREDVQIVDICTPGDSHAEIAIAALEAGKHVLCEKPMANTLAEAEAMAAAAAAASARGVRSMVAFNYRRVPAIALARKLVAEGRVGEIRHVRAQYLQDWLVDPAYPLNWRLRAESAGSGALGDIGSHIVDTTQFILDDLITGVSAITETFVPERPGGTVTVDDTALFLARFGRGAVATFEATRFATGRKNALRIEINGSLGSLAFDFEAMNELSFHDHTLDPEEAGFRRILVTEPGHPYTGAWWPAGHGLGYEHTFTHEVRDFLHAIATDTDPAPSFADGLQVQRILTAVATSAVEGSRWTTP